MLVARTGSKRVSTLGSRQFAFPRLTTLSLGLGALALPVVGAFFRYRISKPDQYLIRTGFGISDILVSKQGFQWPFQRYEFISMHPRNYTFSLHGMSLEKLEFLLPGVFTIGPNNDSQYLIEYVRILSGVDRDAQESKSVSGVDAIILGILEGEVRTLSSTMTMEDIFNNRQLFKEIVIRNIQKELDKVGLVIYNANIKELQDAKDSKYFENMRQKKLSEAENNAKVDIAEARKFGDIGQKEREATTRQRVALVEAETVLKENDNLKAIEISNAEVLVVKSEAFQRTEVARIESFNNARMRETTLQKEVEMLRVAMETEKLRAVLMSSAQVKAEALCKETEGNATAVRIEAEASLFAKQKEAEGMLSVYNAQAEGVNKLASSFGGDKSALIQYIMLDKGMYEKLAHANAEAIRGLNPKITVWNTTNGADGGANPYSDTIANVLKMIPPVLTTIHDQTGVKPPGWMAELPNQSTNQKLAKE